MATFSILVAELLVDDRPAPDIAQLGAKKGVATGVLALLEFDHGPELALPLDCHAVSEITGVHHTGLRLYPLGVSCTPLVAASLDLAEDRVAKLVRARHRAEEFGALSPGGLELDIAEAPGAAPEPLEGGEILDPVDGDRARELRQDALVEDDALVGEDIL